jgi:hypothetical protein
MNISRLLLVGLSKMINKLDMIRRRYTKCDGYDIIKKKRYINDIIAFPELLNKSIKWANRIKPRGKNKINETTLCHWLTYLYEDDFEESKQAVYSIEKIYEIIKHVIANYRVPMLPMDFEGATVTSDVKEEFLIKSKNQRKTDDDNDEKKPANDDIEEIFVRLNTSGTIPSEELCYSIIKLKFAIYTGLQNKIEAACRGIMKPSKFVTLAYRLFQNCKANNTDAIDMHLKPKQLQRLNKNEIETFKEFVIKILNDDLLGIIKGLLKYGENKIEGYNPDIPDYRLPYPLFIKLALHASQMMFVLMYRLYKKRDKFVFDSDTHRQMIGIVLLFMWYNQDLNKNIGGGGKNSSNRENVEQCYY